MSTRSFIGRLNRDDRNLSLGVYHHSDGYLDGVGDTLFQVAQVYIDDLESLLILLIDEHPSGWSTINNWNGDPDRLIGFDQRDAVQDVAEAILPETMDFMERAMTAYDQAMDNVGVFYDGERADEGDEPWPFREVISPDSWIEYAYLIDPEAKTMDIFSVGSHWLRSVQVDLTGAEPDWEALERKLRRAPKAERLP